MKALVAAVLFWAGVCPPSACEPVALHFKNPDDRGAVSSTEGGWRLDIWSPRGIGRAEIIPERPWPKQVIVRLYLCGLEHLRLSVAGFELVLSVRSYADHDREVFLRESPPGRGKPGRQEEGAPFWVSIRAFSPEGKETRGLPPPGGYWEIELPAELFRNHSEPLEIEWIDFYRQ